MTPRHKNPPPEETAHTPEPFQYREGSQMDRVPDRAKNPTATQPEEDPHTPKETKISSNSKWR